MLTIAILTPLPLEQKAIMAHLSDWKEEIKNGDLYHISHFKGFHHHFRIILRQTGSKNNTVALAAERIIKNYQPNILFLTGIAGGVKDVAIGDVVIATKAYGYDSGKEQTGGFVARPEVYLSSKPLLLLAELVNHKAQWQNRTTTNQAPKEAFFGPVAAGDKVIAAIDQVTYSRIKTYYNDTIALEMEAHGVGYTLYNNSSVYWLNIRGVSDLLEGKNANEDIDTQPLAAAHAAAFLFEMLYQLNAEQLNLQIMDIKTITGSIITALTPFLQKSKSIKTITKDISEASDTTLSSIWTVIKPIFIEEFEEEEDVLAEEAAEEGALNHVLKKKLKKEEGLKEQLEALLKERDAKQPTNSTVITNSKNVISGSTISAGGDFNLGDRNTNNNYNSPNHQGSIGNQYNFNYPLGEINIEEILYNKPLNNAELQNGKKEESIISKNNSDVRRIRQLIRNNKVKEGVELLLILSNTNDMMIKNQAVLLANRWNELNSKTNKNVIDEYSANIERNKILNGVLEILTEI